MATEAKSWKDKYDKRESEFIRLEAANKKYEQGNRELTQNNENLTQKLAAAEQDGK